MVRAGSVVVRRQRMDRPDIFGPPLFCSPSPSSRGKAALNCLCSDVCGSDVLTGRESADCEARDLRRPTRNAMEAAASAQAATLAAEAVRLAELVAVVKRLAAARPCDSCALRSALVALIDSGLSDRTLSSYFSTSAVNAMEVHSSDGDAVVISAVLRVSAALYRAEANLATGYAADLSLDGLFARTVALMGRNPAVLSVQADCVLALADYLSLDAEFTRAGEREGVFWAVHVALREHGSALESAAEPALNRVVLSATAFLSARLVTELDDFMGTVGAITLVLAHSKDAGAVKQALEVLSLCCYDGSEALLTLEPAKVRLLASSDVLSVSLELCLDNHATDQGVVVSLLNTLQCLANFSYHRLPVHLRAVPVALAVPKLVVRIMLANTDDEKVQVLGCTGLFVLCVGYGFSRGPVVLNSSFLQHAITAGAAVPVATALHSAPLRWRRSSLQPHV